jgi:hypothetical protein
MMDGSGGLFHRDEFKHSWMMEGSFLNFRLRIKAQGLSCFSIK